jgi:preprotein translocase SecE subunit
MLEKLKAYKFFDQVKQEAKKVVWPEKKELMTSVLVVFAAVFAFGVVSMIFDYSVHSVISFLLNIGK